MNTTQTERRDALVVGGSLAGLSVAWFLTQYGYKTTVLEKAPQVGGIDASFSNGHGRTFDHGVHALDFMRSQFTTNLFTHILNGEFHKVERKRAMVLRNHVIPYNTAPESWPDELRGLFKEGEIVDDLAGREPNRENLGAIYGPKFAALIFDEALQAYPSETHHLQFGVPEFKLTNYLYPWYFPRVPRKTAAMTEMTSVEVSRQFQAQRREEARDYVLYPNEGGFGRFAEMLKSKLEALGTEVLVGLDDMEFDLDDELPYVNRVRAHGRWFEAPRVFWTAPPPALYRVLGRELPKLTPDRYAIGSFQFTRPLRTEFNEILLADPSHQVNRMTFTGSFADGPNDQVQTEFAYPIDDARKDRTADEWQALWVASLRRLGVLQDDNELVHMDYKGFPILYNTFGIDGKPPPKIDFSDFDPESNILPVLPTLAKININTRIPLCLKFLTEELLKTRTARSV